MDKVFGVACVRRQKQTWWRRGYTKAFWKIRETWCLSGEECEVKKKKKKGLLRVGKIGRICYRESIGIIQRVMIFQRERKKTQEGKARRLDIRSTYVEMVVGWKGKKVCGTRRGRGQYIEKV